MNRTFATSLATAVAVVVLASPLVAYEFALDGGECVLGDPINQSGTKRTESSPPVDVRVNRLRVDDTNNDGSADSSSTLPDADFSRLSRLVDTACRYWEQVPSSAIALRLAGSDQTSTYKSRRSYVLVTLGTIQSPYSGLGWGSASNGQYFPSGIIVSIEYFRRVSDAAAVCTIIHEMGHQLGLKHSSCDRQLTNNARFGYTDSQGAFMTYGDVDGRSALHSDDVAAVTHGYPTSASAGEFGAISGELVDGSGAAIFGGNVFAVDGYNRAKSSRISGLYQFTSLSTKHGRFRITGLPPGTYTLVAASVTDTTYRIGQKASLPYDSSYRTSFSPAIVKQVSVSGGKVVDLGKVVAGTEKSLGGGDTTGGGGTTQPTTQSVALAWPSYPGASSYFVYVYSYALSKWILYGQKTTSTSYTMQLESGKYRLYVYAYVSGSYKTAEDRIFEVGTTSTTNAPPRITVASSVSAAEPSAVSIPYTTSDPEGKSVSVKASGMPAGMTLYADRLYWSASVAGSWTIRLTATDAGGASSYADVKLSVSGNQPPTITAPGSVSAVAPGAVDIAIGAVDPEGGSVTVSVSGQPAGMQVSSTRLYWSPSSAGSWTIRITATDPAGKSSTRDVSLVVAAPSTSTSASVTFQWPVRTEDRYYYLSVYSYASGTWVIRQYASGGSHTATLPAGKYYVVIHRWTATSSSWQTIGTKTFDASGTTTVTVP